MPESILQLEPISVDTALGKGQAIIFESTPDDNFWTVVLANGGQVVTFKQKEIRVGKNFTYGRRMTRKEMAQTIKRPLETDDGKSD